MSRFIEPTAEQEREWKRWVSQRPLPIAAVAERFDPWTLYRMKSTGKRVTLISFDEEESGKVTMRVKVTGQFNLTMFDREVFGVDPDDLEQCDPPADDETTGTILTHDKEIKAYVDEIRLHVLKARKPR